MSNAILSLDGIRLIQTGVVIKPKSQKLKERAIKTRISEDTLSVILRLIKEYKILTTGALKGYMNIADSTVKKYVNELKRRGHITSVRDRVKRKTIITFVNG